MSEKARKKDIMIIQPNAVTNARYDYCQVEKDIMYFIIAAMQKQMNAALVEQDIYKNIELELKIKDVAKANNYNKLREHVENLMKKPISYYYNRQNRTFKINTNLICSSSYEVDGKFIIFIPKMAVPVLLNMSAGFTAYNKTIALTLPSLYAKRMYEICCRWKDKGFYRVSLFEFRKMFCLENKHLQTIELRKKVLDVSQRLLDKHADVTFTYELRKEGDSRSFNWLYLWITCRWMEENKKEMHAAYQTVFYFLFELYRNSKAHEITDMLLDRGELKRAADRIKRLKIDVNKGRVKRHGVSQYTMKILQEEFKIPKEILGECYKQLKQREAMDKLLTKLIIKEQKKIKEKGEKVKG